MPGKPDVLIVGAGPVGLAQAILLHRLGFSVRIFDQSPIAHKQGRADAINARTMEIMDSLGVADKMLEVAIRNTKLFQYREGKCLGEQRVWACDSKFDFETHMPQWKYEDCLIRHLKELGIEIERGLTLVHLDVIDEIDDKTPVRATMCNLATGMEEVICVSYLFGIDGGRSFVRKSLGIPFEGVGDSVSMYILDADIEIDDTTLPTLDNMNFIHSPEGAIFTLRTATDNVRMVLNMKSEFESKKRTLEDEQVVQQIQKMVAPHTLKFRKLHWLVYYTVKELAASEYMYKDRIFLVGDACHVFSPQGGQGLNTGVADAQNIAWKLWYTHHGIADKKILQTYQGERRDIALQAIKVSGHLVRLQAQLEKTGMSPGLNSTLMKEMQYTWAKNDTYMTGVGVEYDPGLLILRDSDTTMAFSPMLKTLAGARMHEGQVHKVGSIDSIRFFDLFPFSPTFQLLVFVYDVESSSSTLENLQTYLKSEDSIMKKYGKRNGSENLLNLIGIFRSEDESKVSSILEGYDTYIDEPKEEEGLFEKYGIGNESAIVVVRPDNFIGCCVELADFNVLDQYFNRFYNN